MTNALTAKFTFSVERVLSFKEGTPCDGLSWWKRWICRLFGITPEVKYGYSVSFLCEKAKYVRRSDLLFFEGNIDCSWFVLSVVGETVNIVSTKNIARISELPKSFVIVYNAYSE